MGSIGIANSLAYAPNFQKGLIAAGKMNQLFNRKPKIHDPISLDGIQPKWVKLAQIESKFEPNNHF